MSLMTRHVAGESLAPHVASRLDGCGVASAGGLLSRLGMGNPWTGESTVDPRAAARAAREARLQARLSRFDRAPIRASHRMWPGENRRRRFSFGLRGLGDGDMVFPLMPFEEEEVEEEEVQQGRRRRRKKTGPMRPVAKPWHSVDHAPARVIRGGRRQPAARTARVSRSGARDRFEPAPRVRQPAPVVETVVAASPTSADAKARDLVAATPARQARTVRAPAPVQRSAAFRTVRAPVARRTRAMDRTGDRISALLGRVQTPSERAEAPVAQTRRSVTAVRETIPAAVARSARTDAGPGSVAGSTVARTASSTTAGARTSRTSASASAAARSVRTASSDTAGARSARTRSSSVVVRRERDSVAVLGAALARAARPARDRDLPDAQVRPLAVATGRVGSAARKERRRGLRPVFRHSPVMAVVDPELAETPEEQVAEIAPRRRATAVAPRAEVRRVQGFAARGPVASTARVADSSAVPSASTARTVTTSASAPVARSARAAVARTAGTGWVARRLEVGTAESGSFLPRVMTRPAPIAVERPQASAAPAAPTRTAAPLATATVSRTASAPSASAGAPVQASTPAEESVVGPPASPVTRAALDAPVARATTAAAARALPEPTTRVADARRDHVAGVLRRFESGAVVPGSTLPVAVPRKVRTGKARSLWLSSPEAIMPEAPAAPEPEVEAAPAPRSRPTQSPRVIRSSDRTTAPATSTTRVARTAASTPAASSESARPTPGASSTPSVSRSAKAPSAPAVSTARTARTAASTPSVMDFGRVSRPATGPGQSTTSVTRPAGRQPRATERAAARVTTSNAAPPASGASVHRTAASVPTAAAESPATPPSRSAAAPASRTTRSTGSTPVARAASRSRAIEVAAARSQPLRRTRSLVPRRPRPTAVRHAASTDLAPMMADGRPSAVAGTAPGSTQGYTSTLTAATRPQPAAAGRIERRSRGMSGRRIVDDAAVVSAETEAEVAPVETAARPTPRSESSSASPRVIRAPSRVERLATEAAVRSPVQTAAARATSTTASTTTRASEVTRSTGVTTQSRPGQPVVVRTATTPAGSTASTTPSTTTAPTQATRAFARSARTLATSAHTPARVSSVLHAAARAALGGDHDQVERLLRVADTAVRREEAAQSLMPKVSPRHGSRKPSMWSALRSPVDSAVGLAPVEAAEEAEVEAAAPRRARSGSTVPVVRSGTQRTAGSSIQRSQTRRTPASVKAAERSSKVPVSSDAARTVLRAAPPQVRARVKALLSRRSRPSALGYARLADVEQVVKAVSQAVAETGGQQAKVQVVRDTAGRRRVAQSRKAAAVQRSRPAAWAGARTASAVTDPDPRIRRAVSAMSVFRTALGEMTLPASEVAEVDGVSESRAGAGVPAALGERQGRHVLRTADGRFVSARSGKTRSAAPTRRAELSAKPGQRRASTVDTDGGLLQAPAETAAELAESTTSSVRTKAGQPYRSRPGLQATLGDVDETSAARPQLPVWARRASGTPLVRSSEQRDVMKALAGANTPEQVVQVIAQHGTELTSVPSTLPAPVLKVIEQVREGARADLEERFKAARTSADGEEAPASRPRPAQKASPEAQVVQQLQRGLRRRKSARRQTGQGDDRVMKLAKKLQSLIHLAQGTGDRDEARRHVRMAEDSAAARSEGQNIGESGGGKSNAQADIESLVTEVVQSVNRELALRRERRQEDPDGGNWW